MIKIRIKTIQDKLEVNIKRNTIALGLDTATKTGYALAKSDDKYIYLDIGFINVATLGITDRYEKNNIRYNAIYDTFNNLIKKDYILVIEDVFYGGNSQTLILLSRIGAIAYTIGKMRGNKTIIWKTASSARKTFGWNKKQPKGESKKYIVEQINTLFKVKLENNDVVDAIILALNGLVEE